MKGKVRDSSQIVCFVPWFLSHLATQIYIGDFKRFRGTEFGYSFVFPKEWVGDQAVELAKIQQRTTPLDYNMRKSSSSGKLPDAGM
jgi:hypothetical protein